MDDSNYRIGHGYDVHRLEDGKKFIVGGIEINHSKGAVGHSDADVVIHVICDALLGAMSLGDIGSHFPDTESKYKGIDSKILLQEVVSIMKEKKYDIVNIDVTILLEKPKLRNHIDKMRKAIAKITDSEVSSISVKATTTEGLGFVGREEGVAAHCVCLIKK
ncbi:MAG: 2-C-methyl-D-erythritol 2,4-cyclodiphosphate synthase [Cytophagia bacterium]|jgi:2-C-methyl-D-erythritol 2,4-cyclodiphosphate synthase|nr:2-C-methyl-D-erythritol 2,4-cyclodiphosphate synthase [Cytophagia bacterium]|tara:strand:- start:2675 stop:3160 length:486 start_codon:yes stop_codon:yes gene_type:complete